jgi:hypothetical protein
MPERGGRYEAIHTGNEVYSTQALQELKIERLEQEFAVLKQRNADLLACLDEAVAYIHPDCLDAMPAYRFAVSPVYNRVETPIVLQGG